MRNTYSPNTPKWHYAIMHDKLVTEHEQSNCRSKIPVLCDLTDSGVYALPCIYCNVVWPQHRSLLWNVFLFKVFINSVHSVPENQAVTLLTRLHFSTIELNDWKKARIVKPAKECPDMSFTTYDLLWSLGTKEIERYSPSRGWVA